MSNPDPSETVHPPAELAQGAHLGSMSEYLELYDRSVKDPEGFWAEVAEDFHWFSKWDRVKSHNYDRRSGPISIEWFSGVMAQ